MKPEQPFESNPNKEHIRRFVDQPLIEGWFQTTGRPLKYLGLPAWQMLDIVAWQRFLGRFTGIERAENQQHLMFLQANVRDLEHRLYALYGSFDHILLQGRDSYNKMPEWPYDLVNLDYFGGFIYADLSRPKAFKKLIENQAAYEQSFLLIVTQHLRDGDSLGEKDKFLTDLGSRLKGAVLDKRLYADIDKVVAWYRDAQIPDAARQGLYMNLFFREAGEAEHFKVTHDPRDSCAHHGPEHYHIIAGSGDGFLVSSKVLGRDGLSRSRRCPRVEPGGRLAGLGFSRPRLSGLPEAERSGVCQPRILVPFRAVAKNGHGFVVE